MISKKRIALLATTLLLPFVALGVWHIGSSPPPKPPPQVVKGPYLEPSPPSRLYGPGTINMVEEGPNGEIFLHRTCNVPESVLEGLWVESPTNDMKYAKRAQSELIASTEAALAESSIAAERLVRTSVSFRDARVITMSQEDLFRIQREYVKGNCEEAIIHNISVGQGRVKVCQTSEVLQADLVYDLTYQSGLDSAQKAQLTRQIAAELSLSADTSQVDELRGEDLFYGVRLEQKCFVFEESRWYDWLDWPIFQHS